MASYRCKPFTTFLTPLLLCRCSLHSGERRRPGTWRQRCGAERRDTQCHCHRRQWPCRQPRAGFFHGRGRRDRPRPAAPPSQRAGKGSSAHFRSPSWCTRAPVSHISRTGILLLLLLLLACAGDIFGRLAGAFVRHRRRPAGGYNICRRSDASWTLIIGLLCDPGPV